MLVEALEQILDKYGPFSDEENAVLLHRLVSLMGEEEVSEIGELVEMARPPRSRN